MGGELLGEVSLGGAGHDGGELLHFLGAGIASHGGVLDQRARALVGAATDTKAEALGSGIEEVGDRRG